MTTSHPSTSDAAHAGCSAAAPVPSGARFWNDDEIPAESREFGYLRSGTQRKDQAQKFTPQDRHCGIWRNSPNQRCHASFGDAGTTASVSCFGDLIQMTQFLGIGSSGVFAIDHVSTAMPYDVCGRAQALDDLAKNEADHDLVSFGCRLDQRLQPPNPPTVKWVNWRWPRYEWEVKILGARVKVCRQWIVHGRAVLAQTTLQNLSEIHLPDLRCHYHTKLLIRDLDHLDRSSRFNKDLLDEKYYHDVQGPRGFGRMIVHDLFEPGTSIGVEGQTAQPNDSERQNDGKGNQKRQTQDTWTRKDIKSVASVMVAYENGLAKKMDTEDSSETRFRLGASGSEDASDFYEIVTAYKLVPLPSGKVSWQDCFLTAEEVDVSGMLLEETGRVWKSEPATNTGKPLNDYVLTVVDTSEKIQEDQRRAEATTSKSASDSFGFSSPGGKLDGSSPRNHIEFLLRRHLEHILSVCSIPLKRFNLLEGEKAAAENPRSEERVALTCGDMSGHRVCTSASYFGFEFLVSALHRLKSLRNSTYVTWLCDRIETVCRGHILWIQWLRKPWEPDPTNVKSLLKTGCFAANYWVNGSVMPIGSGRSWQPRNAITDTPYQLLKLTSWKGTKHAALGEEVLELLKDICTPWLHTLESLDKRGAFAWPHSQDDGINTFRLDDHVLVWRSVVELQKLNLLHDQPLVNPTSAETGEIFWNGVKDRWLHHIHSLFTDFDGTSALEKTCEEFSQLTRRLDPPNVRNGILQHFTVENEVLRKRMVALTRSPRETRFLLHARDTVLFQAHNFERFFTKSSFHDVWLNTLNAQPLHEGNTDDSWENSLRFMLGIIIAIRGFRLNDRTPTELLKRCIKVIIGSSSHNGFIPGELDPDKNHAPSTFARERDRDHYYHVGFEACYIFLLNTKEVTADFQSRVAQDSSSAPVVPEAGGGNLAPVAGGIPWDSLESKLAHLIRELYLEAAAREVSVAPRTHRSDTSRPISYRDSSVEQVGAEIVLDTHQRLMVKKILPFNNGCFDTTRINTFEEEWLYQYPAFLNSGRIELSEALEDIQLRLFLNIDRIELSEALENNRVRLRLTTVQRFRSHFFQYWNLSRRAAPFWNKLGRLMFWCPEHAGEALTRLSSSRRLQPIPGTVVTRHVRWYIGSRKDSVEYDFDLASKDSMRALTIAYVIDIPKKRYFRRRDRPTDAEPKPMNNKELWEVLRNERTAKNAKKRFIWLPRVNDETAFLCYVASIETEKSALSLFFDRHASFEKYVFEETNLILNIWRTELHLSFYVLGKEGQREHAGLPASSRARFSGQKKKEIRRASMGFRFDGDLFDRYWTCHFIQYIPTPLADEGFRSNDDATRRAWEFDFNASVRDKEKHWWQRNVLELHFLKKIVDVINSSASDILHEVKQELGVDESMFTLSILDGEVHKSAKDSSDWQRLEQILRATDEDVTEILENLQKWYRRVDDRGQTQPRWTRNDERKYRGYINQVQAPLDQQIWELGITRNNLRSLRESLTSNRETEQRHLETRRQQNIQYFTYVTVIFLPLGFSASFYSMNGPPERILLMYLVQFAAAAFAATIVMLFLAKPAITVLLFLAQPIFQVGNILSGSWKTLVGEIGRTMRYARVIRNQSLPSEKVAGAPDLGGLEDVSGPQPRPLSSHLEDTNAPDRFWLVHLLLEIPAQQLSLAMVNLKTGDRPRSVGISLLLALALLPVYILSRTCQLAAHSAMSLIRISGLIFVLLISMFFESHTPTDRDYKDYDRYFKLMTKTPQMLTEAGPGQIEDRLRAKVKRKIL